MTKAGLEQAQAKHDVLVSKREVVLIELQRAREMGDLSENGAYKAARFELSDVDRELRRLNHLLKYGVVALRSNSSTAEMGSTLRIKGNGKEMEIMLVSTYESDPVKQRLSVESPIGQALLGKKKGEVAEVSTPGGKTSWEILEILRETS